MSLEEESGTGVQGGRLVWLEALRDKGVKSRNQGSQAADWIVPFTVTNTANCKQGDTASNLQPEVDPYAGKNRCLGVEEHDCGG